MGCIQNDGLILLMSAIVHLIACLCFYNTYNRDISCCSVSSSPMITSRVWLFPKYAYLRWADNSFNFNLGSSSIDGFNGTCSNAIVIAVAASYSSSTSSSSELSSSTICSINSCTLRNSTIISRNEHSSIHLETWGQSTHWTWFVDRWPSSSILLFARLLKFCLWQRIVYPRWWVLLYLLCSLRW